MSTAGHALPGAGELPALLASLQNTVKLQAGVLAKFEQRDAQLNAAVHQRMAAMQSEVQQLQRRVEGIVSGASSHIAEQAKVAVAPATAEVDRATAAFARQLQGAGRTLWTWYAGLAVLALLLAAVAWAVLGYYRRELRTVKDELGRYENAIPVLQAYYASDVAICGGRVCVNVDPDGQRAGDRQQYRQARPRPNR